MVYKCYSITRSFSDSIKKSDSSLEEYQGVKGFHDWLKSNPLSWLAEILQLKKGLFIWDANVEWEGG